MTYFKRCAIVAPAQMQKARELTLLPMLLPLTGGAFLSVDLLVDVNEPYIL